MCHSRNASNAPRTATAPTAARLTASTVMMMLRWDTRSATMPPTRMKARRDPARQAATNDSAEGSSASAMTCNAITTVHIPSAKMKIETAAISSRKSRKRRGASTRHPRRVPATGSTSMGVLTRPWSPNDRRQSNDLGSAGVERLIPQAAALMSVCAKSSPLNSNGSPLALASA